MRGPAVATATAGNANAMVRVGTLDESSLMIE